MLARDHHSRDLGCRSQRAERGIVECTAFVNWSRIEIGNRPVVALSFYA
jgi:hypothetical protein